MKFMLMMQGTAKGWTEQGIGSWPLEDIKAHIGFMKRFQKELSEQGVLVSCEGLATPDQARVVRGQPGGLPAVTDGPFPESKEFLAGYWIVDVESPQQAYAIAARASAAPGKGGAPLYIPIEVRQVMSAPPVEP